MSRKAHDSSETSADPGVPPFFRMPIEVRVQVYRYLVHVDHVPYRRVVVRHAVRPGFHCPVERKTYAFELKPVMHINRQITREAQDVLFRENAWVVFTEYHEILLSHPLDAGCPMVSLKNSARFGDQNDQLQPELNIEIRYSEPWKKKVSCFAVSRQFARSVCNFILTDTYLVPMNLRLTFNTQGTDLIRQRIFMAIFDGLHGMNKVQAVGCINKREERKLIKSIRCQRSSPSQWIAYGQACQLRGEMYLKEYRVSRKSAFWSTRYSKATEAFDLGWREMRQAILRSESGKPSFEASELQTVKALHLWFGDQLTGLCPSRNQSKSCRCPKHQMDDARLSARH